MGSGNKDTKATVLNFGFIEIKFYPITLLKLSFLLLTSFVGLVSIFHEIIDRFNRQEIHVQHLNLKSHVWTDELKKALDNNPVQITGLISPATSECQASCSSNLNSKSKFILAPNCSTYPLLIADSKILSGLSTRSVKSVPCFMYLTLSIIPNAHIGVFSNVTIPEGYMFGPYEGRRGKTPKGENESFDVKYTWSAGTDDDGASYFIDGMDENQSNWLRFVNAARYEEEQNIAAILIDHNIYYYTYKEIQPHTELLVWYGEGYGKAMDITVPVEYKSLWTNFVSRAPPKSITLCPSCFWTYKMALEENSRKTLEENTESLPGDEEKVQNITTPTETQ